MFRGFTKNDPLIPVQQPRVGQMYHTSWASSRAVKGKCKSVDKEKRTVILITPSTGKEFKYPVKWSELRHTRKNQLKNPH